MKSRLPNEVSPSGKFARHALSAAFSVMEKSEMEALVESIQRNGQLEEIVMFEGCVLDGWNRVLVCEGLGVEPRVRQLDPSEVAVDQVVARNFARRNQTHSRKAVSMADLFYQVNRLDITDRPPSPEPGGSAAPRLSQPSIWTTAKIWPKTRAELASLAGVSETLMKQALRLRGNATASVVAAVRSGEVPLEEALKLLWQPLHHQTGCLAELMEERAKAKVRRRAEQREAAVLKKAGLLFGDKSMSTAERIQASTALPRENSLEAVDSRTNVDATADDGQVLLRAIQAVDRCAHLLTVKPDCTTDDGGIDMLAASCAKLLGLVAHRLKSMELGTSFGGGGIEEHAAS